MKNKTINYIINIFLFLLLILSYIFSNLINNTFVEIFNFIITIIIPSLFPFMIFVNFILLTNAIDYLAIIFQPIGKILKLSGYSLICLLSAILGGYPYNAILISLFLKEKKIDKNEANRLLLTSFFPSLSFLFFTLKALDNNFIYIIISLYLTSFILLIISAIRPNEKNEKKINITIKDDYTAIYFQVMKKSITSILLIAFSIVFFNLLTALLSTFIKNETLLLFIGGILEFSSFSSKILLLSNKRFIHYFLLNIIISFSSFSIIFQSLYYLKECNISIKKLLIYRLATCLISSIIFSLIYLLFI